MPRSGLRERHIFCLWQGDLSVQVDHYRQLATRLWLSGIKLQLHQFDLYFAPYQGGGALQA